MAPSIGVLLVYLAGSAYLWHSLLPTRLSSSAAGGGLTDPSLYIWWLNWTPYAILHGLNPFVSSYLLAPKGVNAMQNTSVITLGLLLAPVTEIFGAVTSFNIACILGPALSAWTANLWLRRHYERLPAFLGGLLFGFSPFEIDHLRAGHINLTVLFLVPLIVMLVEDLLWRSERPWWPQAPLLGLLIGAQLLLSTEALVITAFGCTGLCVLIALTHPGSVRHRLPAFALAGGVTLVVAGLLCAWPLYEGFATHPGLVASPAVADYYVGKPAMLVNPPDTLVFHTAASAAIARARLTTIENGLYIGIPLLVVLAVAMATSWRRRGVLIAATLAALSLTVQLGWPTWLPGLGHRTPLRVLQDHLQVLSQLVPARFAVVMWLALAFILADVASAAARLGSWRGRIGTSLIVLSLVPLLPLPAHYQLPVAPAPPFFTTADVNVIPAGATVMVAPMATVRDTSAMLWQVDAGMRFRQIGGRAIHPGAGGLSNYFPYPPALDLLFEISPADLPYEGRPAGAILAAARAELRASGAVAFLLANGGTPVYNIQYALVRQLLGSPPDRTTGDVSIWFVKAPY